MKKLLYVLSVMVLVSCGQHKKDIAMQATQDSITQVAVQKNNVFLEFIDEMNEIQSNLDSIKAIEEIILVKKASGIELNTDAKKRIAEDMAQINDLLQKNEALVKSLTNKYRDSNAKITELETTINNMNLQMAEKDAVIASLETISTESEKVIRESEEAFEEQANVMNTAYWAFGTKKELEDKNVIEKEGGVLSLEKTLTMKDDFNRDYFKKVDIREFKQLTLNAKKAVLLTKRPADSYHIIETDRVEGLVIDKPDEFWKDSKYLVVVLEKE